MSWLFLVATAVGLGFTVHAFAPLSNRRRLYIPSFVVSWLTIELAAHHLAWQVAATAGFVALGALQGWAGWAGLVLTAVSWLGLVVLVAQGRRARAIVATALEGYLPAPPPRRFHWWHLLVPFPIRAARARATRDVEYARAAGRRLRLDIYQPDALRPVGDDGALRPALVQIHGGGWVMGDKRSQGIPLLVHACERGFVGFNVNYRLSPSATFPDHLVDIKRAIAWIREHAAEYRVDPDFVAVTGGSAGGHLAALVALTTEDLRYQPGFEAADCSVQACVPVYAALDFTDRNGSQSPDFVPRFLEPIVMKAFFADEPEKFRDASPIDRVHADAPPFFVVHGDRDTMTPLVDAEQFVDQLRAVSRQPVVFARVDGAQHAFDVFLSPRSAPVIEGVAAFLHEAYRRQRTVDHLHDSRSASASAGSSKKTLSNSREFSASPSVKFL
jgi:acetyl esterase/lipase